MWTIEYRCWQPVEGERWLLWNSFQTVAMAAYWLEWLRPHCAAVRLRRV